MKFFENLNDTTLSRFSLAGFSAFEHPAPARPRVRPAALCQRAIARAAAIEVLG